MHSFWSKIGTFSDANFHALSAGNAASMLKDAVGTDAFKRCI
jgi:hypothetical protein